eukprot:XP_011606446.1 PREDICTED: kelch-like protein 15 isoform X2 [Takifugu rubripes]
MRTWQCTAALCILNFLHRTRNFMSEGARASWSKRGCGDSHRREPGKHKHRKCERPLSAQLPKPVIVHPGSKRCVMSGADVEVYLSQVHDGSVSSGFRALYEERLLLDVTLLIEEHHFQAHKALLATQSDYFRVMFTADMRERDQDKIHMKGLTAAGFGHILRFMYYGSLELSMPTVQEILQAAMYVQLKEAVEFCCSFLLTKICLENCAEVMRLLEDFSVGVEGVQEQLDNFLLDNFVPLMSRPDFLSYLGLERLQAYLSSDALSRFPEIELYEAVQTWLRHDRRRWRHTDTIVQSLRFCLMTPANIFEKVKTSEFYRYSRQLRQEVDQTLAYFHDVNQQPLVESRSNRIRSVRPQTAVFRGMIGHSMVNSKILLLQRPKVWWELEGPQVPLRPDCLAIVNNFAFLLGGEELGPDGEFHASSKVYRYDPRQNSWLRMADMSVPRVRCGRYRQVYLCCGGPHPGRDLLLYRTLRHHRGSLGVRGPVPREQVRPRGNRPGWETVHHRRHHLIFHFQASVCVRSRARGRGRGVRRGLGQHRYTQDTQQSGDFGTGHPRQLLGEQIQNELCPLLPQDDRSQREAVRVWRRVRDPPCFLRVAGLPVHRSVQPRHGRVDDPRLHAHRAQRPRGGRVRQADHGAGWPLLQRTLQ